MVYLLLSNREADLLARIIANAKLSKMSGKDGWNTHYLSTILDKLDKGFNDPAYTPERS